MYKEIINATLHYAFYYDFDNDTLVSEPIVAWAMADNRVFGLVLEQSDGTLRPCDEYVNFIGVLNSTQLKSKETLKYFVELGRELTAPYKEDE